MSRTLRVVLSRAASAVPTLLIVACGAFLLLELAPGDAVDAYLAETGGDAGYAAELRRALGLGGTLAERLAGFLLGLATLDLGRSLVFARPVVDIIAERLPNTLLLMACAALLAVGVGFLAGRAAGARPGSPRDRALSTLALALLALPNFWLGLVLVVLFAVILPILPVAGLRTLGGGVQADASPLRAALDLATHLVLPTLALGAGYIALSMRAFRAGMVEAWRAGHVRAARARGLTEAAVLRRQVVWPALPALLVAAGQNVGALVGGSVVVETVFAIPGMGRLAVEAVAGRDAPLLVGVLMTSAALVLLVNLLVDIGLSRLDPRIGQSHA
jgi:peptide/nickel transport system permease protein